MMGCKFPPLDKNGNMTHYSLSRLKVAWQDYWLTQPSTPQP